jgi:microcystin-dependent protein
MATGVASWSQTASSNATADSAVNFAEGQAPSSLNDSCRAGMASVAKWRDDISGAITSAGTSTAYTVTSSQGFATLAALSNQLIAFVPHADSGATVTLAVDGLAAKPLRPAPGIELAAGDLVTGTPYLCSYNNSSSVFYLVGAGAMPTYVPLGALMDYTGTTAPNSRFVLPFGQAISRTTYATYFAMVGTTYGTGDGSTTFNVADLRGRTVFGKTNMGGSDNGVLSAIIAGPTLGAKAGAETVTLSSAQIPATAVTIAINQISLGPLVVTTAAGGTFSTNASGSGVQGGSSFNVATGAESGTVTIPPFTPTGSGAVQGSGGSHSNLPPAIILNKILRVL